MARRICSECGTTINTENVEFSRKESSLVYLDKVYSYNQEKASVFLQTVSTEGSESLISELTMGDTVNNCNSPCGTNAINPCNLCVVCCGTCGSSGCTLDANAVFTVERSYVLVDSFELATPTDLATTNVSIEGNPVSSLTYESGQFSAGVNTLLPNALRCKCLDNGIPSKVYFLVEGAGPWIFAGRIVIEGRVTTGGKTCPFRYVVRTGEGAGMDLTNTTSFAIARLALPCSLNGVGPTIRFNFGAAINVLDPQITVTAADGVITTNMSATLAVEPKINVEVIRKTMFCLEACEGMLPCDGSIEKYLSEIEEEEDPAYYAPPCGCGTKGTTDLTPLQSSPTDCPGQCAGAPTQYVNTQDFSCYGF